MDNSFFGNIVTTSHTSGGTVQDGQIRVSDGGVFYFNDKFILIEGPKWLDVEKDYDFESLTGKKLRKVVSYKAQWEIKFDFMGRETFQMLMDLESMMEKVNFSFDPTGATAPRKFYFTPAGDETRPTLEVVKISKPPVNTEHFGGRYIGYKPHNLILETVQLFETKRLPMVEPIITDVMEFGTLCESWASPDIEVFT